MGVILSVQARRALIEQMRPHYRQATVSQKGALLHEIAASTGYARRYAMWLLNHPESEPHSNAGQRQRRYGPEVQHALFVAWQAANRICSKRLISFLPTLIEALERHGHLHLSDTCRNQLLSMSAATADRLLQSQRRRGLHGIATTHAGTLLKQHIPIRTFEQWNEKAPGFLEADLVAHCGPQAQGSFLYTLTLTDIATGWTECVPLRSKHAAMVLSAVQQAQAFFPFPIRGLDTDNGSEFLNEPLLSYCEQEGITFTRGRPDVKNDQCYIEQKNGAIVRQVVGYDHLEGEFAYQQLGELYQALRLYVNCFQPSMKLQAKQVEGRKVRRVYDAAKTPLQRLLLSQILSASKEQEVQRMAHLLDPLRLFHHVHALQQALFGSVMGDAPEAVDVLSFCLQHCVAEPLARTQEAAKQVGQQERSDGGACESVSPRTPLSEVADLSCPIACSSPVVWILQPEEARSCARWADEEVRSRATTISNTAQSLPQPGSGPPQVLSSRKPTDPSPSTRTIEHAIQEYLQDQVRKHRRPKTLEWHQKALGLFEQYLRTEHRCVLFGQVTQLQVHGWFVFLQTQLTARGSHRSANTVQSYARSARAFCHWAVRQKYLPITPFAHLSLPHQEHCVFPLLEPEAWRRLLLACQPPQERGMLADQAAARNRAILWILFETGMQTTELCRLRLSDVDLEQGVLSVRGNGAKARQLTPGQEGWRHLLIYLENYRLRAAASKERGGGSSEPLFLLETGGPLTKNSVALLFGRLSQRVGMTRKGVTASLLRKSFVVRYLRAGGDPFTLQRLLGYADQTTFVRSLDTC